jgi:hypothetical protein
VKGKPSSRVLALELLAHDTTSEHVLVNEWSGSTTASRSTLSMSTVLKWQDAKSHRVYLPRDMKLTPPTVASTDSSDDFQQSPEIKPEKDSLKRKRKARRRKSKSALHNKQTSEMQSEQKSETREPTIRPTSEPSKRRREPKQEQVSPKKELRRELKSPTSTAGYSRGDRMQREANRLSKSQSGTTLPSRFIAVRCVCYGGEPPLCQSRERLHCRCPC